MRKLITLLILLLFLAACAGPTAAPTPTSTPVPTPTPVPPTTTPYPTPQLEEAPSPTTLVEGPRMVTFQSEDGITLGGTLYGSGRVGVVLSHMFPTDQTGWANLAQKMADLGYLVLTYDFRGYGQSEGQVQIDQIDKDLRAAVAFIRQQGVEKVVLVGASMGGTATVKIAAEDPRVAAIVVWSSPLAFRGLAAELSEAAALTMPALFLGAEADPATADTQRMSEAAPKAELFIYSGDSHGTFALETPQGPEVEAKILGF
ncbi:MAG: alpha/beta hydrolase family protein, partial [Anaerolineae bacterium]